MILVFIIVYAFLWGYNKKFPNSTKFKKITLVTALSILISIMISFSYVYGFFVLHSPLSLPFYMRIPDFIIIDSMLGIGNVVYTIFFVGLKLLETNLGFRSLGMEGGYIFAGRDFDIDYGPTLFTHLFLIFTALNLIGFPLAVITYRYRGIWKGIWNKLSSKITRFQEEHRDNRVYQWLFPE